MTAPHPVRRRLDVRTEQPAGGGDEFLSVTLTDVAGGTVLGNALRKLHEPEHPLVAGGLTVEVFLDEFLGGERLPVDLARAYGRLLYTTLFEGETNELRQAWQDTLQQARSRGLRLEIHLPRSGEARWRHLPVALLPFELLHDGHSFLFRRPNWSSVRRLRRLETTRPLRKQQEPAAPVQVQVGWANVTGPQGQQLPEADFIAHEDAAQQAAGSGRTQVAPSLRHATRASLMHAIEQRRPHVLVWIGHGGEDGSTLLLHDGNQRGYPNDLGAPVTANDFAAAVRPGEVDVALLWSCHSAGSTRALSPSVAEALLDPDHGDLAAVVASFSALESGATAQFSAAVLAEWARHPQADLEDSLTRARTRLDEQSLTWARPVLFLRTPPESSGLAMQWEAPGTVPAVAPGAARLPRWPLPERANTYVDHTGRLEQALADVAHHPLVLLTGLPGIGKTELALAVAHQLRAQGHDVVFIDVTGLRDTGNLVARLSQLVAETPFEDDAALCQAFAEREWLLVVDNAEDLLEDPAAAQRLRELLRGLIAVSSQARILVATRRSLARSAESWFFERELAALTPQESQKLFVAVAGPRLPSTPDALADLPALLTALGGIARAIALMAGQLGGEVTVSKLLVRLQEKGSGAIVAPDLLGVALPASAAHLLPRHVSLPAALDLSLASVRRRMPEAEVLFAALGAFPAGLEQTLLPHAEFVWLQEALAVLLEHHLIDLTGESRRISVSAPVNQHAWSRLQALAPDASAHTLLHTMLVRQAEWVGRAAEGIGRSSSTAHLHRVLAEEANAQRSLDALTRWRVDHTDSPTSAALLMCALAGAARFAGRHTDTLPLLAEQARVIARHWPGSPADAQAKLWLALVKTHADDLDGARADYEAALPIYRQINARLGEANALQSLGRWHMAQGQISCAFALTHQAMLLQLAVHDHLGAAGSHGYLARIAARADCLRQSAVLSHRAIQVFAAIGDRFGLLLAHNDLMQNLIQTEPAIGLAALAQAAHWAAEIHHPAAGQLNGALDELAAQLAPDGAAEPAGQLRAQAAATLDAFFQTLEAEVASGQLDPYAPPPEPHHD